MPDPFENVDDPNAMYTASERRAILERAKNASSADIARSIMSNSLIRSINAASVPEPPPAAQSIPAQAEPSSVPASVPTETVPSLPKSLPGCESGAGSFLQETGAVQKGASEQNRWKRAGWIAGTIVVVAVILWLTGAKL